MEKKKFRLKFMFQEIDLQGGEFLIGRSPSCNLTLEDPLVSRQHARISAEEDVARIEDLGSRNGTMVNGEPLFDSVPLHNKDRIRIGSHEMVFLEESRFPSRPLRPTGAMISCPSCKIPFAAGASNCPHCNTPIVPDDSCKKCKKSLSPADSFCPRCGTPVDRRDDTTIPVELGGGSSGWTSNLVNDVIRKAISARRFDHAARLVDGKVEEFELRAKKGAVDLAALMEITDVALELAVNMKAPERVDWVLDHWMGLTLAMPMDSLDRLAEGCDDWYDLSRRLKDYLARLASKKELTSTEQAFVARLEEMTQGASS